MAYYCRIRERFPRLNEFGIATQVTKLDFGSKGWNLDTELDLNKVANRGHSAILDFHDSATLGCGRPRYATGLRPTSRHGY